MSPTEQEPHADGHLTSAASALLDVVREIEWAAEAA